MSGPPPGEAARMLRALTAVLCAVGVLALVFTAVNVTGFATSRGIPMPIAILLDPMISLALAGTLYADARLAGWGLPPPAWSTTMRWGAGLCAALMNTWASLWPDGRIGLPRQADPAAVLLHLTPPLLLIALAETIAAYRRLLTEVHHRTPPAPATAPAPHPRTLTYPSTLPNEATAAPAPPTPATRAADDTDRGVHPDPASSHPRSRHVHPSDSYLFAAPWPWTPRGGRKRASRSPSANCVANCTSDSSAPAPCAPVWTTRTRRVHPLLIPHPNISLTRSDSALDEHTRVERPWSRDDRNHPRCARTGRPTRPPNEAAPRPGSTHGTITGDPTP